MSEAQTVYFDESGFTGNNLLNPDQPMFVYTGLAIDSAHASHMHTELRSRFRIRTKELKGKNLVKYTRGKQAISWLLNTCRDLACITVSNKKFALAGKFFEYIFEPILAPQSSIFYAANFHKFICTLLYVSFEAKREYAEHILAQFESLMITQDCQYLEPLLVPLDEGVELASLLGQILTFVLCHQKRIEDEIKDIAEVDGVNKWALELTTTSLFGILSFWGERCDSLKVYCDKSKPLKTDQSTLETMIGRKERIYQKIGSNPEAPITFNLAEPIILVDSKLSHGVQLADIISSALAYALKNPEDELSHEWLSLSDGMAHGPCILPETKDVDLQSEKPFINALILKELVDRTLKGNNLFTDMAEFIYAGSHAYRKFCVHNNKALTQSKLFQ